MLELKILDHCAGSGAFLVKAMANMIKEVGGVNTKEAEEKNVSRQGTDQHEI